jgi:trimeric autotransporter adhesin
MKKILSAILGIMAVMNAQSQNIAINETGNQPDTSAMLDISSTTRGLLIPRMTKVQRNAIALPATGLMVFQTGADSTGFHYYNGTQWLWFVTNDVKNAWEVTGNTATDSTTNFVGTTDDKPVMLRQNNLPMGQLNTRRHNFFIGGASGQNNSDERNTGFGDSTLTRNTTGSGNTAMGFRCMAGGTAITGIDNTAAGQHTLLAITSGSHNTAAGGFAMASMTTGIANVATGVGAMEYTIKGSNNVALGFWALRNADSTNNNVAVGHQALYSSDSSGNTGVGYNVLYYNNRKNNTAVGMQAGVFNNYLQTDQQLGIENTYVGYQSGYYANTGSKNVAIGHKAMLGPGYFNSDQPNNNAYKRNVAVGDSALFTNLGNDNVGVGFKTLSKSYSGSGHVAVGSRALTNTTATYPNTAIGYSSQDSNTIGYANTSLGSYSLVKNTGGFNNTVIGNAAMYEAENISSPSLMQNNTAIGNDALRLTRYYGETAIGSGALRNDTGSLHNTAVGYLAMHNHLRGSSNTALGTNALYSDTTGVQNTAIGVNAMYLHRYGDYNTAVGVNALYGNVSGNGNVAVGARALRNANGNYNIGIGDSALFSNNADGNFAAGTYSMRSNNTGSYNTATGYHSLLNNTNGHRNTAFGDSALLANATGTGNTGIGYLANTSAANLTNTTAVGANAYVAQNNSMVLGSINGVNGATADTKVGIATTAPDSSLSIANKFSVGNSGTLQFDNSVSVMNYMFKSGSSNANRMIVAHSPALPNYGLQYQDAGDKFNFLYNGSSSVTIDLALQRVGIGIASPAYQLQLSADGAAKLLTSTWTTTSDMRLKTLDGNYTKGLQDILKLNTIMYHYAEGNARGLSTKEQGIGFSAQEVQKIFPEAVMLGEDGYLSLNIHPILISYVNAIKEQQQQIEELKKKVAEKETAKGDALEKLMKRIEALEAKASK